MWKKKLLAAALAAGLALSLGTGAAAAALTGRELCGRERRRDLRQPGGRLRLQDEDGNGLCDWCGLGCGSGWRGGGHRGQNFVDADGDGVCDNLGTGRGQGGQGQNFVDADGDGVCDRYGMGQGRRGAGNGQGFRGGRNR